MHRMFKPTRIVAIILVMAVLLTLYVSELYKIQIFDARAGEEGAQGGTIIRRRETLAAARGSIYDRNGVLLASDRPSYNILLSLASLRTLPVWDRNELVLDLIYAATAEGIEYNDSFPITQGAPFTYITDMSADQRRWLDRYIERHGLDANISESDLLAWMRGRYGIDYTIGITDARLIVGVRFELEMRTIITNLPPYVFATDVSTEFVSLIEERGLIGLHVERGTVREYYTSFAAHLLGYIGRMSPEDLETLSQADPPYPLDAQVGKTGAERAFENELRGVSGLRTIQTNETGAVVGVDVTRPPQPGNHIFLTMDIGLQGAVENALRVHIESANLELDDEELMITGGAVVVTDVWTGEVLAAASNPTYDPRTLASDFDMLQNDPTRPMWNRAMQGRYSPGSTFKMVTALAALRHGTVSRWSTIDCIGVYREYENVGYRPTCWVYPARHGHFDVVQAIAQSCNYYFMQASDYILGGWVPSAYALAEVAQEFGLGVSTGIQMPENIGLLSIPEVKMQLLNDDWMRGDTVATAFGQGWSLFTPLQLANYAATLANGGTLYSMSILRRIRNADMTELTFAHVPEIRNVIAEREYMEIIQEGMRDVTRRGALGTGAPVFNNYPIPVAAKTGTVQIEGTLVNNGVFVCYAPANNPEIAVAIVVERGVAGSAVMDVARMIFDYYFRTETTVIAAPFGELIP